MEDSDAAGLLSIYCSPGWLLVEGYFSCRFSALWATLRKKAANIIKVTVDSFTCYFFELDGADHRHHRHRRDLISLISS